jgi:plasmid maintenance system antidote protein VapI
MDNRLLDHLIKQFGLHKDAALARELQVSPPVLSKIRHGKMSITPAFILRVHETFDIPIKEIKKLANVK